MKNYLLDTNACIALISGKPTEVRRKFHAAHQAGAKLFVSSIAYFELWYGVEKSQRKSFNADLMEKFLAGPLEILPFEEEDSRLAGRVRASLEMIGTPIGAYDTLIAGQALRLHATLVTANTNEFQRVHDLDWENWATQM